MTSENSYCYINDIIILGDNIYLKVDFIKFLKSNEAIEEAKKRGDSAYDINDDGDTSFYVYNDYYIVNDNQKLRTFKITDSTKFEFLEIFENIPNFKQPKQAIDRVEFSPFFIETNNGLITKLKEIYIP